ncbi:MAG: hypothetical protein M3P98_01330 [bacterium]|nr:hypothetical protein [bacterium]
MKEVNYVTGNDYKFSEAVHQLKKHNIKPKQIKLDIDEIQEQGKLVAIDKARKAYEITKKPILVNDASWEIPALNGFPGPYMKDVQDWFSTKDFINLMRDQEDRTVLIIEYLVYKDANTEHVIEHIYKGKIVEPRGGDKVKANSIEKVAEFNGKTLAEHHDSGKLVHNFDSGHSLWDVFAEWYNNFSG